LLQFGLLVLVYFLTVKVAGVAVIRRPGIVIRPVATAATSPFTAPNVHLINLPGTTCMF